MKISKTLLGAIALLGMTGIASAQTKIYITGATTFRASINNQIDTLLNYSGGGVTKASDNATFTSANVITWTGGNIGGTPVTIKVSYSGAAAGIQTVAGAPNFTVGFLPDGATGTSNPDPRTNTSVPRELAVPDIATSIVFQGTTLFNGTFNGVTYATLKDKVVAVLPITFAGSANFPKNLNVTPQIAQTLFPGGSVPLSEFTGSSADENTGVIATGRNADGGTRLNVMAETNVGVNTTLSQYKPAISGGSNGLNATITGLALYPALPINGVNYGAGDGGESSDSTLRNYLTDTVSVGAVQQIDPTYTGGFLVTYIGLSDFNAVAGNGAVAINYNGVPESQANIIEGAYTLWGYVHIAYKSTLGDGNTGGPAVKLTFATQLVNQILGTPTANLNGNIAVSDLKVQRFGDGGPVSSLLH
jgi:hypothetical protein